MFEQAITEFFNYLSKFQYEKAKTYLDKYKDLNNKIMMQMQTVFIHLINGEKYYNNLIYLSSKSVSKFTDKYYEPASLLLEQMVKENSYNRISSNSITPLTASSSYDILSVNYNNRSENTLNSIPIDNLLEFIDQLSAFIELRHQLMKFYFDLKENRNDKLNIEISLSQLSEIEDKYKESLTHPLVGELKNLYCLEVSLIKCLLQCHISIDSKFDCIKSIVCIKSVNDIFLSRLPLLNANKQSKETKGFSIFSRSSSQQRLMPGLYQWFKVYYQCLLNKFSLIMHDSLPNDVDHIMNEKNETYNKLFSFLKKSQPSLMGIILDASRLTKISFRGIGYELIPSASSISALPGTDCYHFVFLYPKQNNEVDKHIKSLSSLIYSELDQKVRYSYDNLLRSSYYLCKLSEYYTFFLILEQNKQENKGKTTSFVQEISDDLNLTKVLENLK